MHELEVFCEMTFFDFKLPIFCTAFGATATSKLRDRGTPFPGFALQTDQVQVHRLVGSAKPVGGGQWHFAAPDHHDFSMFSDGAPALEASLSHPT